MKNKMIVLLVLIFALFILLFPIVANAEELEDDIPLPKTIQLACIEAGHEYCICPELLMSIVYQETRGVCDNATQITSRYWYREGIEACDAEDHIKNPYSNIRVCAYYLNKWFEDYGDAEPSLILEMWNEGVENAQHNHKDGSMSVYAKEILERSEEWEIIAQNHQGIKP